MAKPTVERPTKKPRVDRAFNSKSVKGSPRPTDRSQTGSAKAMSGPGATQRKPLEPQSVAATKAKGKAKVRDEASPLPRSFKIVAGSYEKLLYGLDGALSPAEGEAGGYTIAIKPTFAFPAHVSCIKSVAASPHGGKWLATGSADEIIKVWDLRRKKEIGGLMHHEGSITHLSFPSRSHLLSASEDGTLTLFRARDWAVLRSLKGHKGPVNSVAVHPSGKVALSVGKDRTLRMWDLMRGKGSASTKLGKEGELVRWNVSGSLFVVQSQATLDIYSTKMQLLHTITHPSRLHDVKFAARVNSAGTGNDDLLLSGGEDKKLTVYSVPDYTNYDPENENEEDIEKPTVIAEMTGHTNRVKAIDTLTIALPPSSSLEHEEKKEAQTTTLVCTISSDGKIFVYDLADVPAPSKQGQVADIKAKAEYDTKGTRLTCVTFAEGELLSAGLGGKRKREEEVAEEGSEEEVEEDGWSGVGAEGEAEAEGELEEDTEGSGSNEEDD